MPATAGWLAKMGQSMAPAVPTTPPVRLSKIDSMRIIRTTRQRPQPIARRMPISLVRSKTDITIVFNMPTAPITNATAEVTQAIAWTNWISLVELTNSAVGVASRFLPNASMSRGDPLDIRLVVGMFDDDGEAAHLALAAHEPLQIRQQHRHAAVLVDRGALEDAHHGVGLVVEEGHLVADVLVQAGGQAFAQQHAFVVGVGEAMAAGQDVPGPSSAGSRAPSPAPTRPPAPIRPSR